MKGITQDSANGLTSYPSGTNFTGTRSTSSNYDDGFLGFVTKQVPAGTTWNARYFDPGLPWGVWQVCADYGGRRNFATVINKQPNGTSNYVVIDVHSSASGSQAATCGGSGWPTTAPSVAWPAPTAGVAP
jgi:hypothetical protein